MTGSHGAIPKTVARRVIGRWRTALRKSARRGNYFTILSAVNNRRLLAAPHSSVAATAFAITMIIVRLKMALGDPAIGVAPRRSGYAFTHSC